jgi:hypothetical protein
LENSLGGGGQGVIFVMSVARGGRSPRAYATVFKSDISFFLKFFKNHEKIHLSHIFAIFDVKIGFFRQLAIISKFLNKFFG